MFGGTGGGQFSSFFDMLFGGAGPGMGSGPQTRTRFAPRQGAGFDPRAVQPERSDVPVKISLEEAFAGATRTLERSDGSRVEVSIPRGVKSGSRVRVRNPSGQGELHLKVEVQEHERFRREGDNVQVRVPMDLYVAVLGGEVQVPTLERPVMLSIPAGAQSGKVFRLRGLGMPNLKNPDQRGDLLAEVEIRVPEKLSERERKLFEELRSLRK